MDVLELSSPDLYVVHRGAEAAIARCMTDHGFRYEPELSARAPESGLIPFNPSKADLAQYGYAWRSHLLLAQGSPGGSTHTDLDDEALAALNGTTTVKGCAETGAEAVKLGELNAARQTIYSAAAELDVAAQTDPQVLGATTSWAECMTSRGYVASDLESGSESAAKLPGGVEGPAGVQMAIADYECRDDSGLTTVRDGVAAEMNIQWIESNPTVLEDFEARLDESSALANQVLEED